MEVESFLDNAKDGVDGKNKDILKKFAEAIKKERKSAIDLIKEYNKKTKSVKRIKLLAEEFRRAYKER